jgi:chorismate mutase
MTPRAAPPATGELASLRRQVDELDRALIDLLARRRRLVARAGVLPAAVPAKVDRLFAMLKVRRNWAELADVDPDQVEVLFTFIIQDSISQVLGLMNGGAEPRGIGIDHWHRPPEAPAT